MVSLYQLLIAWFDAIQRQDGTQNKTGRVFHLTLPFGGSSPVG